MLTCCQTVDGFQLFHQKFSFGYGKDYPRAMNVRYGANRLRCVRGNGRADGHSVGPGGLMRDAGELCLDPLWLFFKTAEAGLPHSIIERTVNV